MYVHIRACDAMAITWSCSGGEVLCNSPQLVTPTNHKFHSFFSYCCSPKLTYYGSV